MNYIQRFMHVKLSKLDSYWRIRDHLGKKKLAKSVFSLNETQQLLLRKLSEDGIATLHLSDFLHNEQIELIYQTVSDKYKKGPREYKKKFLEYYVGGNFPAEIQNLSLNDEFVKLAVSEHITKIAACYLQSCPNLCYIELNRSKVIPQVQSEVQSQRWHRDPALRKCLKVFIYWNDVETNSGPFEFIPRTQHGGQNSGVLRSTRKIGGSFYPSQKSVSDNFKDNIYQATGKKGTVVLADTSGLHRGGNSKTLHRDMSTFVYYPSADFIKPRVSFEGSLPDSGFLLNV